MKKGMFKRIFSAVLIGVTLSSLVGCGKEVKSTDTLANIKKAGKLVVGINADYAPYGFHAMIDGKDTISGVDVELAKEVAKDMGVELELKESQFDVLINTLKAEQVDVVISCLSSTDERKEQIDFSEEYSKDSVVALVRAEDSDKYKDFDDLKGKRIGAAYGTIEETLVKKQLPNEQIKYLEGMNELFLELKAGQLDAVVSEETVCKMAVVSNPKLVIAKGSTFDTSLINAAGIAVGIRKDSDSLKEQVNKTISRLKESGEMDKIIDKSCDLAATNIVENK